MSFLPPANTLFNAANNRGVQLSTGGDEAARFVRILNGQKMAVPATVACQVSDSTETLGFLGTYLYLKCSKTVNGIAGGAYDAPADRKKVRHERKGAKGETALK